MKASIIISLVCLGLLSTTQAYAQVYPPPESKNIDVTVSVGDTTVTVVGQASPEAQITFMLEDTVIGTTQASLYGNFSKVLNNFPIGIYELKIYATDTLDNTTSTIKKSVASVAHYDVSINRLILPPTIEVNKNNVEYGDEVRLSGKTVPDSLVSIFFFNDKQSKTVISDSEGHWSTTIQASKYDAKKYQIYARTFISDGKKSDKSETIVLEIIDPDADDNSSSSSDSTDTTGLEDFLRDNIPSIFDGDADYGSLWRSDGSCGLPKYFSPFDSDSTCKINYDEFLILVQEWYDEWNNEDRCDVNEDNDCDLVDFSVILYYVNR